MAFNTWEWINQGTLNSGGTASQWFGNVVKVGAEPILLAGLRVQLTGSYFPGAFTIWTVQGSGTGKTLGTEILTPALGTFNSADNTVTLDGLSLLLDAGAEYYIAYRTTGSYSWWWSSNPRDSTEFTTVRNTEDNQYSNTSLASGWWLNNASSYLRLALFYESLNAAPNAPTNLGVNNTGPSPRASWTFSDLDAGDSQSKCQLIVERWDGAAWAAHLDTGEVTSANQYHDLSSLSAQTTYRFRVRTADQAGAWGPYSANRQWTTANPYQAAGAYTSEVLNVGRAGGINNGTLSWTATTPAGTSLTAEYSADGGAWTSVVNGGSVPPANTVQVRFNFATTDEWVTPELHDWSLTYPVEHYASGEWVSPILDTRAAVEAYEMALTLAQALNGGAVSAQVQVSADGITWGAWESFDSPETTWDGYVRFKLVLTSTADRITSPSVASAAIVARTVYNDSGVWISPAIDIRGVDAEALVEWLASANIAVSFSVSENDANGPWSAWTAIAASGNGIPVDLSVVKFIKLRADLTRIGPNSTPDLDWLRATVNPSVRRGFWVSDVIDVSQAKDRTTGKVASDTVLGSDTLITRYSYSTDGGASFSAWGATLADGTISTPANTTHVRIMHVLIGQAMEVKSSTLYFDGEPAATLLAGGFTADSEWDATQLRDKLVLVNGSDAPRKWDGDTISLLGGSPPVLRMVEEHLNRVWGVERDNPSRVRWSDALNPESWPALSFIDFSPEDGAEITALRKSGAYMLVGKANGVYLVTGDRDANFAVSALDSHDRGPTGMRSITALDKYIVYVGMDGVRISDLTKSVVNSHKLLLTWEKEINHRRLNQAAVHYWNHHLLVALPSKGSLYNDTVWVLDTLRNSWARYTGWNVSCWLSFKQYGQEILLAGDSQTGQVYQVLTGDRDDGALVEIDWESGHMDLGYPERLKLFGNHTINVEGKAEARRLYVEYTVIGGTNPDGDIVSTTQTFPVDEIIVPAGEEQTHTFRILPPVWGAVLGQALAIKLITSVDVHSMTIDMTARGIVPGGLDS